MSTVEITFTGLFLVVPNGNDFTILLPMAAAHPHLPPEVGTSKILNQDIDLTGVLPRGGADIPPHYTVPIKTLSGGRPVKSHLLESSFPTGELKARIKIPKPTRINGGKKTLWAVGTGHTNATNEVIFEYDGYAPSTIPIPSNTGPVVFPAAGGLIRVPFIHRAKVEPTCIPKFRAHHVLAYYDLIDAPVMRPVPELAEDCPAALIVLELADEIAAGVKGSKALSIRRQVKAAIAKEKKSLSTFTCLVGSGT